MSNTPQETMIVEDPTIAPLQKLAVSVRTAADLIGVSERTMTSLVSSGEIPSRKVGGRRVIPLASLNRWVNESPAANDKA